MLGRQRRPARADRRGPRAGHAGRARRRVQPRRAAGSSRSTTSWRTARTRPTSTGSTSTEATWTRPTDPRLPRPVARAGPRRCRRDRRAATGDAESCETPGYRAWWDLPALPKLNTDNPEVREYLLGVAEHWIDSASTAGGSTWPTRSTTTTSGASSGAGPGRRPRRLHRRRGLAREPQYLQGDM